MVEIASTRDRFIAAVSQAHQANRISGSALHGRRDSKLHRRYLHISYPNDVRPIWPRCARAVTERGVERGRRVYFLVGVRLGEIECASLTSLCGGWRVLTRGCARSVEVEIGGAGIEDDCLELWRRADRYYPPTS